MRHLTEHLLPWYRTQYLEQLKGNSTSQKNEMFHEATSFSFWTTLEFLWMNSTNMEFHSLHFYHHHDRSAKAEDAREPTSH